MTLKETASYRVDSAGKHSLIDITKGFTERTFTIKIMVCSKEMTNLSKKGLLLSTNRGSNAEQAWESLPGRQSDALTTLFMYASTVNVNLRLLTTRETPKRDVTRRKQRYGLLEYSNEH